MVFVRKFFWLDHLSMSANKMPLLESILQNYEEVETGHPILVGHVIGKIHKKEDMRHIVKWAESQNNKNGFPPLDYIKVLKIRDTYKSRGKIHIRSKLDKICMEPAHGYHNNSNSTPKKVQRKKADIEPQSERSILHAQERKKKIEEMRQACMIDCRMRSAAAKQRSTAEDQLDCLPADRMQTAAANCYCETEDKRQARLPAKKSSAERKYEIAQERWAHLVAKKAEIAAAKKRKADEKRQARLLAKKAKIAAAKQRKAEKRKARLLAAKQNKGQKKQIRKKPKNPDLTRTDVRQHFPIDAPPVPVQVRSLRKKRVFIVVNHQHDIMSNMASLWRNGKFCDASIGNEKTAVKVHKLVLYAMCPKLVSLLKSDMKFHEFLHVNFPEEVSREALIAFAEYMYGGILDLDHGILEQLKIIAKAMDMKEFEKLCNRHLHNNLPATDDVATDIRMNEPSVQFPSMTSYLPSLSSITTRLINIKQEISESEQAQVSKDTTAVSGQESEVASLTLNQSGNADGFVIGSSIKTESVEPEDDEHDHVSSDGNSQSFTSTVPSSSSSSQTVPAAAASTSNTSVPASQTEISIPFSETADVESNSCESPVVLETSSSSSQTAPAAASTSNTSVPASQTETDIPFSETADKESNSCESPVVLYTPSSSSQTAPAAASTSNTSVPASQTADVESNTCKSPVVSDTSPVSFSVEKVSSQSSDITKPISKPLSQLSNSSSGDLPTTSDKSVYPVRLYKSVANNLPP